MKKILWCVPVEFEVSATTQEEAVQITRDAIQAGIALRPHPARIAPKTRRVLAFLGFILAYIALPLALIAGIYALNAMANTAADRASAFYQQTQANH